MVLRDSSHRHIQYIHKTHHGTLAHTHSECSCSVEAWKRGMN